MSLVIEPFEKFSRHIRAKIEKEAASLGGFLNTPCGLKFSK